MQSSDIRALTGLRGVAACYVAIYHINLASAPNGVIGNVIRHGYIAVDLFFVLSGFVMALTYGHFVQWGMTRRAYVTFLIRRIARVYPLYACTTVAVFAGSALALIHAPLPPAPGALLAANLLMIQSWGIAPSINIPAWSISTEWAAYLLFPLMAGLTLRSRTFVACAAAVIAIAGVAVVALSPNDIGPDIRKGPLDVFSDDTMLPLARCLCEFTLGLLCFRLERRVSALPDRARGWLLAGVTLVIALLLGSLKPESDIILVLLFASLVILLARGTTTVARLLGSPIAFQLGILSYAIYLLHGHMYELRRMTEATLATRLAPDLARVLSFASGYATLLVAAWLAYTFIEQPARNIIRRLERLVGNRAHPANSAVGSN